MSERDLHGAGQETEQARRKKLHDLALAHLVLQEGAESTNDTSDTLRPVILMTTEEARADNAVLARMKTLCPDVDEQAEMLKLVELSVGKEGLQTSHRNQALATVRTLVKEDRALATENQTLQDLNVRELKRQIARREKQKKLSDAVGQANGHPRISKALTVTLHASAILAGLTAAAGAGSAIYFNNEQHNLPAVASTDLRSLVTSELHDAVGDLQRTPAQILRVPNPPPQTGTTPLPEAAKMPDTNKAWNTLLDVKQELQGTQPTAAEVTRVMARIYNPTSISVKGYPQEISALRIAERQIVAFGHTSAADLYRRESVKVDGSLASMGLGVTAAVFSEGTLLWKRNQRKGKRKQGAKK